MSRSKNVFFSKDESGSIREIEPPELKKLQEELVKSEKKYRSLITDASAGVATTDLKGNFTFVNKALCKMIGYSEKELIGKTFFNLLHPEDKNNIVPKFWDAWKYPRRKIRMEFRAVHKDGHTVHMYSSPTLFIHKNMIAGFNAIITDITERKLMEEELKESEARLSGILSSMSDSVFAFDIEGRFTFYHTPHIRSPFTSNQQFIRLKYSEVLPLHVNKLFAEAFERNKRGETVEFEYWLDMHSKVSWFSVRLSPIKSNDNVKGSVAVVRDITESKKASEERTRALSQLRATLESTDDGIIVVDHDGKITDYNQRYLELLHPPESVLTSGNFSKIVSFLRQELLDPNKSLQKIKELLDKPEIESFDLLKFKDGRIFEWYSRQQRVKGKSVGRVFSIRDITKREKMEEELKQYSKHLEELVEARTKELREAERLATIGETAAMVGHDLRNPLQAIVSILYLAKRKYETLPQPLSKLAENYGAVRLFTNIDEQIQYMNKIVSDLQDYAGPMKLKLVMTNIHELINETLSTDIFPDSVKVFVESENKDLKIMLDRHMIKRVFTNLITNAIQAMPNGGKLTIKVLNQNGFVLINFTDTGVGISREIMDKLFHPFFTNKAKGQGLGLAVCKRLIDAHEGKIIVDSRIGEGSTFTIKLPVKTSRD